VAAQQVRAGWLVGFSRPKPMAFFVALPQRANQHVRSKANPRNTPT